MIEKVASNDSGTARLGITVAQIVRRKTKITMTTSPIVSIIVNCTSCTAARTTSERSDTISTFTEGGTASSSFGIIFLIVSTSSMMLVPACFWIASPSPGVWKYQAPIRLFCTPSTTSATSFSRTGAPLR